MKMRQEEAYENLANAIVLLAVEDYRKELKSIKQYPQKKEKAIDNAKKIEKFFRSGWYGVLTGVDGEYLIQRLREEAGITEL